MLFCIGDSLRNLDQSKKEKKCCENTVTFWQLTVIRKFDRNLMVNTTDNLAETAINPCIWPDICDFGTNQGQY